MLNSVHFGSTPEVQNMRNRGGADGKWGDATSQALRRVYNFTGTVITEQQFNDFLNKIY